MAIGVVTNNTVAEPDNFLRAKIVFQILLDFRTIQPGIAIWIEQALLGRKQTTHAVNLN